MANITDIVNSIVRYLGKVSITLNGRWKDNIEYDRLCVVYNDFASYISKQKVPAGTKLTNTTYWQILSNLQEEIKIDYETFKAEVLKDIVDLNKRQIVGRIVVGSDNEFSALTIEQVNAGAEVYILDTKKTYIIDSIDTQNNKEYHEQVYNSLSTVAYSSISKEDRKVENIKVLKDYSIELGDKLTTFPITLIQAILDLESGKNLSSILNIFNYFVLPWNGNFAATVNEVPLVMRNFGTLITYKDTDGFIWTKRYKLSDFSNANWSNIDNWEGWDLQIVKDEIIAVVEKIFINIDDYPPVKEVIVSSITTATNDVLNDITSHPDLYAKFKTIIETKVGDVFKNLDSYPDLKNLLNTYVVNQVNYIFANINSYPILKTTIENSVKFVFTNINSYPTLKKIITDKIVEIAPGLINTIFTNINNYPTLKSAIELGVYSRTDYVFKHLDNYPELKAIIESGSASGKFNMLNVKFNLPSENNSSIINIDEVRAGVADIELMGYKHCLIEILLNDVSIWKCVGCVMKFGENNYNFSYIAPLNGISHRIVYRGNITTNSFSMYYEEKSNSTIYIRAEHSSNLPNGKVQFTIQNEAGRQIWDFVDIYSLTNKVYIFNCVITYLTDDPVWATVSGTMQFLSDGAGTNTAQIITTTYEGGDVNMFTKHEWSWENINTSTLILDKIVRYSTNDFIAHSEKGTVNGICPLNASSKVDAKYLPSYVDDVMDFTTSTNFANTSEIVAHPAYNNQILITGSTTVDPYKNKIIKLNANASINDWVVEDLVTDKIYCKTTDNTIWRWSGTTLVKIGAGELVLGEVTGTAYDGGKGKTVTDIVNTIPPKLINLNSAYIVDRSAIHFGFIFKCYIKYGDGKYYLDDSADYTMMIPLANANYAGLISPIANSKLNSIAIINSSIFFSETIGAEEDITSILSNSSVNFNTLKNTNTLILRFSNNTVSRYTIVDNIFTQTVENVPTAYISYVVQNNATKSTRYYARIYFVNNRAYYKKDYSCDINKGGFDLGAAVNFIIDCINTHNGTWITNDNDFAEAINSGVLTDLVNCVNPLQFMIDCCKNQYPLVCKETYIVDPNRYFRCDSIPIKCMYTNNNGAAPINDYNFKIYFEDQPYRFNIKRDSEGLSTFKGAYVQ